MTELSQEVQDAVRRVEKLLKLAAKNPNEHEAAAATAKAQEILAQYNLDMATVEANSGEQGKREDSKVAGGLYHFQRDLWRAVADLNFCMYWNQYKFDKTKTRVKRVWTGDERQDDAGNYRKVYDYRRTEGGYRFEHRIVGRTVNTAATRVMAGYLQETIERLTRERLNGEGSQFFTKWAVSFREGVADSIISKIYDRRRQVLAKEKREAREAAKRAAEAATQGASTATALTLASVQESEKAANYDFVYGEGAWADRLKSRADAAAEAEREEAAYTAWAKANPEEARALEEKERKRRVSYGPRSYEDRKSEKRDWSAFSAGQEKGRSVGIDPQADHRVAGRLR